MKNLLVIVDMVNGFVNFGALADKRINKVTPTIIRLIEKARAKGYDIVAFKDSHNMSDEEFKTFPPHCIKGSEESELIPELLPYKKYFDHVIEKNTTNGFITSEFQQILESNVYDKVCVCGCCTDICVINYVVSYINYIRDKKIATKIVVMEDGCYTFDGPEHNAEQSHNAAIKEMESMGVEIASEKEMNHTID